MTPRSEATVIVSLVLLAACARQSASTVPQPVVTVTPDAMQADSAANAIIQLAFAADAAGQTPDSIYADNVDIIADGDVRTGPPRLAGVGTGGTVQLGSTRTRVTAGFVWGTMEYRWIPGTSGGTATVARATIIIGRRRDGLWRILHLHSSQAAPGGDAPRPAQSDTTDRASR